MRILVLNGPNINFLGIREPNIYGKETFADLLQLLRDVATEQQVQIHQFQSNHEGALVDEIQRAYGQVDGIVINPAAYTHTSIAILDALKAVSIPTIEVHLSDIHSREEFRNVSITGNAALKIIYGLGFEGYKRAIIEMKAYLEGKSIDG